MQRVRVSAANLQRGTKEIEIVAAKILVVDNPESDGRDLSIEHAELGSNAEIVQLTYHDSRDLEKLVSAASKVTRCLLILHRSTAL